MFLNFFYYIVLCAPGDLGGADNPSGLSLTKLTLQIVFAMRNYREGTPLQAPTKWLNPRASVAIKPRVGAHWGPYPAWGKNKVGRKPDPVKIPIPSEFSYVLCCSKHCTFFCRLWAVEVRSCCDLCGVGLLPNTEFSMGWTSPLFSSGGDEVSGCSPHPWEAPGPELTRCEVVWVLQDEDKIWELKKILLETCHLLKCILGNGYVCSGWS